MNEDKASEGLPYLRQNKFSVDWIVQMNVYLAIQEDINIFNGIKKII